MSDFKLPTEIIDLPSKGLLYPLDNPLSSGKIEMKYMTAKEEDILSNTNFIKRGIVLDQLFKSLIVSKVEYDDLVMGDLNAVMIAARILGYGKNYTFNYINPNTFEREEVTVDLTSFKEKPVDYSLYQNQNEFDFVLPNSKIPVKVKLPTVKDERMIKEELASLAKHGLSAEITTRLRFILVEVNGSREKSVISRFATDMQASDARELRKFVASINPEYELKFDFVGQDGYVQEGVELPLNPSFFYPSTRA